jgi:hypothetical protein
MRVTALIIFISLLGGIDSVAAAKPHVITFGKPTLVKSYEDTDERSPIELKVRGIYVDGRLKEYFVGAPRDITDRVFVIQRAYRLNDALPLEKSGVAQWHWEVGGWLSVDRVSSHIASLALPEFDPYYSTVSWYRDYAAYCGVSDDGKKLSLIVAQIGRRKPIVKNAAGELRRTDAPSAVCSPPVWERPLRVTFLSNGNRSSFSLRGRTVDLVVDNEEDSE